jgi:hypothetical protein
MAIGSDKEQKLTGAFVPRYPKIIIDLIPETSFGVNIRSEYPKEWEIIRHLCYTRAKYHCEICGEQGTDQGFRQSVDCHELWKYDALKGIQKLVDFVALCPLCHKCHHLGFAEMEGRLIECLDRIMKINKINNKQANSLWRQAQVIWQCRSRVKWRLDVSFIDEYLKQHKKYKPSWILT